MKGSHFAGGANATGVLVFNAYFFLVRPHRLKQSKASHLKLEQPLLVISNRL